MNLGFQRKNAEGWIWGLVACIWGSRNQNF